MFGLYLFYFHLDLFLCLFSFLNKTIIIKTIHKSMHQYIYMYVVLLNIYIIISNTCFSAVDIPCISRVSISKWLLEICYVIMQWLLMRSFLVQNRKSLGNRHSVSDIHRFGLHGMVNNAA